MQTMEVHLPDAAFAQRMGWKYHVQWFDAGRPCWYRRRTLAEASRDFHDLTAEGASPFIVDAFTGEPVKAETAR